MDGYGTIIPTTSAEPLSQRHLAPAVIGGIVVGAVISLMIGWCVWRASARKVPEISQDDDVPELASIQKPGPDASGLGGALDPGTKQSTKSCRLVSNPPVLPRLSAVSEQRPSQEDIEIQRVK